MLARLKVQHGHELECFMMGRVRNPPVERCRGDIEARMLPEALVVREGGRRRLVDVSLGEKTSPMLPS